MRWPPTRSADGDPADLPPFPADVLLSRFDAPIANARTGSALWAGAATAARVVPMVVLGPVGGVVADRFGRRGVMIASDLARLVLMLGLTLVAAAHLPAVLAPVTAALATAAGSRQRRSRVPARND